MTTVDEDRTEFEDEDVVVVLLLEDATILVLLDDVVILMLLEDVVGMIGVELERIVVELPIVVVELPSGIVADEVGIVVEDRATPEDSCPGVVGVWLSEQPRRSCRAPPAMTRTAKFLLIDITYP